MSSGVFYLDARRLPAARGVTQEEVAASLGFAQGELKRRDDRLISAQRLYLESLACELMVSAVAHVKLHLNLHMRRH